MPPLERLTPGGVDVLDSATWNTMAEQAEEAIRRKFAAPLSPGRTAPAGPLEALVRNDTGQDVAQYGVLGISGTLIPEADNHAEFITRPILKGVTPQIENHGTRFCITKTPITNGNMGECWVSGWAIAKVDIGDLQDRVCGVTDDDTTKLTSGIGLCQILYPPTDTGEQLTYVSIGVANCEYIAKAASTITARSGTTPGTGTADLHYYTGSVLSPFTTGHTVLNWGGQIASGNWIIVGLDGFGRAWVKNEECSA